MSDLPIVRSVSELRAVTRQWRSAGLSVGFTPTMGALHDGHISLVRLAKARCDRVVASVFVNPTQFAAHEDLSRYPRDETGDATKLAAGGCDLLFAPAPAEMYPPGFSTTITVAGISADLEGVHRPQMFAGVATVVCKLLVQAAPHIAVFGEKDYQQLLVVRRMVRDLDLPVEIVAGPTVREPDGLAMSSRNAYLSADARAKAPALHRALCTARDRLLAGADHTLVLADAEAEIMQADFDSVDYVALRDGDNLQPVAAVSATKPLRLLAAARLAGVRLIDTIAV